jgi:hypothetical protein
MGTINWVVSISDSTIPGGSNPYVAGLTPVLTRYSKVSDGTNITPIPTVVAIAGGGYQWPYDPALGEVYYELDARGAGSYVFAVAKDQFLSNICSYDAPLQPADHVLNQADAVAAMIAQGYTIARSAKIDNLDATISSRVATSALPPNFSVLAITATTGLVTAGTVTDKTGYALTSGEHTNIQADMTAANTAQGWTSARAIKIDNLDATVSSRVATTALPPNFSVLAITATTGLVTAGTVADKTGYALTTGEHTLVQNDVLASLTTQGFTTTRAAKLDNLDATMSSRSVYAATDTVGVTAILGRLGVPVGLTFSADIAAVKSDVDAGIAAGVGTSVTSALTAQGLTSARAAKLDNLDAAVTTRSTYAGGDTSGVTSLLTKIGSPTGASLAADLVALKTDLDAGIPLSTGSHTAIAADVTAALTAQGLTSVRAAKLDALDAAVSTRMATFSLPTNFGALAITSGGAVTAGTVSDKTGYALSTAEHTLVIADGQASLTAQGFTSARATKIDALDAAVSTRAAAAALPANFALTVIDSSGHVALTTAEHTALAADATSALTAQGFTSARATKLDALDAAVSSRAAGAALPVNFGVMSIDGTGHVILTAAEHTLHQADVAAALTAQGVTTARAGKLDNLDAAISSRAVAADVPAALTAQGLTTARAAKLDNLDAAVTTRSVYAGGDTAGVTSLLSKIGSPTGASLAADLAAVKTDLASGVYLATSVHTVIAGDVTTALTNQGLTTVRTAKLDALDANITSRSTYTGTDTAGVTSLLSRIGAPVGASLSADLAAVKADMDAGLPISAGSHVAIALDVTTSLTALGVTSARTAKLDNLDAAITSRSTYAGGDTSGTTSLLTKIGTPVGASISADLAAVKTDMDAGLPLASGTHAAITADVTSALTAQGLTTVRAAKLDALDANVSSRSTYGGSDTAGVVSLLTKIGSPTGASLAADLAAVKTDLDSGVYLASGARTLVVADVQTAMTAQGYSVGRATNLNYLDAAISTRMATFALPTNFSAMAVTSGGAVTAGTVVDKSGYSLTQEFPVHFNLMAIDGAGLVSSTDSLDLTVAQFLDGALASHNTAGTVGHALTNIDASISSRMASFTLPNNFSATLIDSSGRVTAGTVVDKTGYSLTQTFPSNFAATVIDSSGRVQVQYGVGAGQINLASGNLAGPVASVAGSVGSVVGSVGSVTGGVTVAVNTDKGGYSLTQSFPAHFSSMSIDTQGAVEINNLTALLDNPLAGHVNAGTVGAALNKMVGTLVESYAANGYPGTMEQYLTQIWAILANVKKEGTVVTAFKQDGETPAMTFGEDSATNPTRRTRVS